MSDCVWTLDKHPGKPREKCSLKISSKQSHQVGKKIGPGGIVEGKINTSTVYTELNPKCADKGKIK